jgi:hypothetical protein
MQKKKEKPWAPYHGDPWKDYAAGAAQVQNSEQTAHAQESLESASGQPRGKYKGKAEGKGKGKGRGKGRGKHKGEHKGNSGKGPSQDKGKGKGKDGGTHLFEMRLKSRAFDVMIFNTYFQDAQRRDFTGSFHDYVADAMAARANAMAIERNDLVLRFINVFHPQLIGSHDYPDLDSHDDLDID